MSTLTAAAQHRGLQNHNERGAMHQDVAGANLQLGMPLGYRNQLGFLLGAEGAGPPPLLRRRSPSCRRLRPS